MKGLFRAFEAIFFTNAPDRANEFDAEDNDVVASQTKSTVLLIDDEVPFVEAVRGFLKQAGYNVLTATSGPKGLNMLRYAPRDIKAVLLDYQMPGFSGMDTLPYIQKLSPNVKIIGVTGMDVEKMPNSFRDSVATIIRKPLTMHELLGTLESVLNPPMPVRKNGMAATPAEAVA